MLLQEIEGTEELTFEELQNVEGGYIQIVLSCFAVIGGAYKAGQAAGDALWYATH